MLLPGLTTEARDFKLIESYTRRLAEYLPYAGFCPVRESENDRIKYFIVFASRHPSAMLLMNDAMMNAYFKRMHETAYAETLFEGTSWSEMLSKKGLQEVVINIVQHQPGIRRAELWLEIVRAHFMCYRKTDFLAALNELVNSKPPFLTCPTPRKTMRLNDECEFYPA
jgi:hypothetical protein